MRQKATRRGAIYARYSSALQKERSVEDQVALCREFARREGIDVVGSFADRALSGTTTANREGLFDMLTAARDRQFDVLIIEALDRLGRDQEDLHRIRKLLAFVNVEILSVNEGPQDSLNMGMRAIFSEYFSVQLAHKVKRGHAGMLRENRIPGVLGYGYRRVLGKKGEWEIDPEKAEVVRRIFREYVEGRSPRQIVAGLNREGIPAPKGPAWHHGTLRRGQANNRGILGCPVYRGEVRWNQGKAIRNPETGRRTVRAGDPADLVVFRAEHLRIVDDELWYAADKLRTERGKNIVGTQKGNPVPRNNSLLSGLLRCPECGSHMIQIASPKPKGPKSPRPHPRVCCSAAYRAPDQCPVSRSYNLDQIEEKVFETLREQFSDPDIFNAYVDEYQKTRRQLAQAAQREEAGLKRKLANVEASIMKYMTALEKGTMPEDLIHSRLQELSSERMGLQQRIATAKEDTSPVSVHPGAIERAKRAIEALHEAYRSPETTSQAKASMRAIIDHVVVHPTRKRMPYEVTVFTRYGLLFGAQGMMTVQSVAEMAREHGVSYFDKVSYDNTHGSISNYAGPVIPFRLAA